MTELSTNNSLQRQKTKSGIWGFHKTVRKAVGKTVVSGEWRVKKTVERRDIEIHAYMLWLETVASG